MIHRSYALPITRQARALNVSQGSVYYRPRPASASDLALMRRIDELHLDFPFAGSRMLRDPLTAEGFQTGRRHGATLMKRMGIQAVYPNAPEGLSFQGEDERRELRYDPMPLLASEQRCLSKDRRPGGAPGPARRGCVGPQKHVAGEAVACEAGSPALQGGEAHEPL
jgi:hypothetical protein